MTAFKVGDKALHPLTGDTVWQFHCIDGGDNEAHFTDPEARSFYAPAAEFTPYTLPRVSTEELERRIRQAAAAINERVNDAGLAMYLQVIIAAATEYRERLEEESK